SGTFAPHNRRARRPQSQHRTPLQSEEPVIGGLLGLLAKMCVWCSACWVVSVVIFRDIHVGHALRPLIN
ncbi:hypothetical protein, partial [Mycolicibacterium insubricum]|uniref:hypothetical protein n=1 Tax=Mycolicibacterium insubricum TaxID=444597 RepID=UPI001A9872DD